MLLLWVCVPGPGMKFVVGPSNWPGTAKVGCAICLFLMENRV